MALVLNPETVHCGHLDLVYPYLYVNTTKAATYVAAFAYVMPGGTVLVPMGAGTGSWRHNRVAGAGIEPASGGSFTPPVSRGNGLYHNPVRILPL